MYPEIPWLNTFRISGLSSFPLQGIVHIWEPPVWDVLFISFSLLWTWFILIFSKALLSFFLPSARCVHSGTVNGVVRLIAWTQSNGYLGNEKEKKKEIPFSLLPGAQKMFPVNNHPLISCHYSVLEFTMFFYILYLYKFTFNEYKISISGHNVFCKA